MRKLLLCAAAVLCVAASIFGGYYYFGNNDVQQVTVQQSLEGKEATDERIPFEYRSWAWRDENGNIDSDGVANAIAQRDYYLAQHMPTHGFGSNGTARGQEFSPIGPTNLGGRTEAILVDPLNPTTIWAGGASGGVWISYNGGHRWRPVNGDLGNYNVSCLAFDPGDTTRMTIYAGTGAHDLHGDGIFRSIDGGLNWKRIYGHLEGWKYVSSISVARINGNTVILAAIDNDLSDPDEEQGIIRGVITSNNPDGVWTEVQDGTQGNAVAFDPNDPSKAVASVCYDGNYPDGSLANKCKAFFSTNYGVTWAASSLTRGLNSDPGCPPTGEFKTCQAEDSIHFALQKSAPGSGPTVIYAQYGNAQRSIISKSTNGGASFNTSGLEGNPFGINRGVPAFWVSPAVPIADPSDPTVIITGGQDLYRSINGVFEPHAIGGHTDPFHNPPYPHVDMQAVVADPLTGTNKSVFVGTDGGIFYAEDVTAVTGYIYGPSQG